MHLTRDLVRRSVWAAIYLLFVLAPLLALLAGTLPPSRGFWTEFSVALGYSGLAMMGLQFGLTARFRYVTDPWGEDVIYHFHRRISLIAVGLVVVHPIILIATGSDKLAMPDSIADVPLGAIAAFVSIGALVVLVVTALWRTRLRISYELWHAAHIALALVAVGTACTGLAYILFFRLIDTAGPARALTVTFLVPVFALFYGAVFLGEEITQWMLICAVVIVCGVALSTGLVRLGRRNTLGR